MNDDIRNYKPFEKDIENNALKKLKSNNSTVHLHVQRSKKVLTNFWKMGPTSWSPTDHFSATLDRPTMN